MKEIDDFKTMPDFFKFPFKVLIEGGTGCGDSLQQIAMIALELFGYREGECYIDSEWNALGRCHDTSISTDGYTIKEEYLKYWEKEFYYYDTNGECHKTGHNAEATFTKLYGTEHSHTGCYTTKWLGKTGYDYGEEMYFFKEKEKALLFCLLLSKYQPQYIGEEKYEFIKNGITTIY